MPIVDADVKAIVDTKRDTTPFIATAQLLVDEFLTGTTLTLARKDKIVLYLSAHFVWLTETDGMLSAKKADMSEDYQSRYGASKGGFTLTSYGKTALSLDTSGKLAAASTNNGLKARFGVFAQRQDFVPPYPWIFGW